MRKSLLAAGLLWLWAGLFVQGVKADIPLLAPPPASVCASPPTETDPGSIHMWPGRWRNPSRYGLGWDFFYGEGENTMYLTWFTFDASGRPVWLHGGDAEPLAFNAVTGERTWQGRLFEVHWSLSGGRTMTPVGAVSVTFPREATTRAAVRWKWQNVDTATYDECLYDKRDSAAAGRGTGVLNEAFSSNWFYDGPVDDPLIGWGIDFLIEVGHGGPADPDYVETATAAIFDTATNPVWLQSVDDWLSSPPSQSTFGLTGHGMMRYVHHSATTSHPAVTTCVDQSCVVLKYEDHGPTGSDNRFLRDLPTGRRGTMSLHANVPASATLAAGTSAAEIKWPPTAGNSTFPDPVPVFRFDGNHIMVDRSVCRVANREDRCNFIVSWVSDDPASTVISRLNLRTHSYTIVPQDGSNQFVDSLGVDDRIQYQIQYHSSIAGDGTLLTPEVRVLLDGQIADQNPDPVDCRSLPGSGCDLPTHDSTVGAIPGEAGVEGGAATYSIPFALPPGRNGMQPSLGLVYSSRSGNGVAGMGWSLSGLSSIYRCPRTVDQDGTSRPVHMDQSDALCLDGQRLVLMSGTYGQNGARYRTEINSFSRVVQYGNLTDNSACFRVEEKSGRISQYGAAAESSGCGISHNSRVLPGGATATLGWLLDRVSDRVGNNIIYVYDTYGAGENLLSRIYYTGYQSAQGDRAIQISYLSRPDTDRSSSYLAGGLTEQTQRLETVQSFAGGQPGMMYRLSYDDSSLQSDVSPYSGRSLLQKVMQCSGSGPCEPAQCNGSGQCLKPTEISWGTLSEDTVLRPLSVPGIPDSDPGEDYVDRTVYPIGDLDGDGIRELFVTQYESGDSVKHAYLVKQTADRTTSSALDVTAYFGAVYTGKDSQADFDGDGKTDLVGVNDLTATTYSVFRWSGARGAALSSGILAPAATNIPVAVEILSTDDFDGDGLPDLVTHVSGKTCTGGGSATQAVCLYKNVSADDPVTHVPVLAFGTGTTLVQWAENEAMVVRAVGDLNGDGIRDIAQFEPGGKYIATVYMSSAGFGSMPIAGCTSSSSSNFYSCGHAELNLPEDGYGYSSQGAAVFWQDINGDGLTDLLFATPPGTGCSNIAQRANSSGPISPLPQPVSTGSWCLQLSTGRGFGELQSVEDDTRALLADNMGNLRYASRLPIVDIDGDGRPNILFPVGLAARRCELVQVHYNSPECGYPPIDPSEDSTSSTTACTVNVWMCSNDPTSNQQNGTGGEFSLPNPFELPNATRVAAIENTYSPAVHIDRSSTDHSAYVMAAVRFVETENGYRAETVNLDQSDRDQYPDDTTNPRIAHRVVMTLAQPGANNVTDDMYGDGLVDSVTRVGCFGQGVDTGHCAFVGSGGSGGSGPAVLWVNNGSANQAMPVGQLTEGQVTLVNENLGVGERPGMAPQLPELVETIKDGLGRTSTWEYFPLSSNAGRAATTVPLYAFPQNEPPYVDNRHFYFRSSMPVVSTLEQSNGVGGTQGFRSWQYGYGEAMYNRMGRGFQGFRTIVKESRLDRSSSSRVLRTRTDFFQKFPLTGKVEKVSTGVPATGLQVKPISEETYQWGCNVASPSIACDTANGGAPVNFPFVTNKNAVTYDLASAEAGVSLEVSKVETMSAWDAFGNVTDEVVTSSDRGAGIYVTSTTSRVQKHYITPPNYVISPGDDWWLDKLDYSIVSHPDVQYASAHSWPAGYSPDFSGDAVKTVYNWNDATHLMASVEVQPLTFSAAGVAAQQRSVTTYQYPACNFGLPSAISVTGQALAGASGSASDTRTTFIDYMAAASSTGCGSIQDISAGYFVVKKTDPANIVTLQTVRPLDGQVSASTDGAGNTTTTSYDAFGRLIGVERRDSGGTLLQPPVHTAWLPCSNGTCTATAPEVAVGEVDSAIPGPDQLNERYAAYRVTTVQNGSPTQVVWYDQLGRAVKQAKRGMDSTFIVTDTTYDSLGAVQRQSAPFFSNAAQSYATQFTYDRLGRVKTKTAPGAELDPLHGDVRTSYTYAGNRTDIHVQPTSVNCSGYTGNLCMDMHRYQSVLGLVRTEDAAAGVTRFWFDAAGRTVAVADANTPAGVSSSQAMISTYDALGRRIRLDDPNQGSWTFTYNPAGELLTQTDARGWTTTVNQRDADGRPLLQTAESYTGMNSSGGAINKTLVKDAWTYDSARPALLQQQQRSVDPLTGASPFPVWQEAYSYDAAGRTLGISTTISLTAESKTLATSFQYDGNYGREKAIEYPSGLIVQTKYNRFGYVVDLLDGTSGERYWGIGSQDAWGNPTLEQYGNGLIGEYATFRSTGQAASRQWRGGESGSTPIQDKITYQYDSLGNLAQQTRFNGSLGDMAESYTYDALQRLTSAQPPPAGTQPRPAVLYAYDKLGNFKSKSDFSSTASSAYAYQAPADGTSFAKQCGPNVAQQITLDSGLPVYFHCDLNGNVIHNTGQTTYAERSTVYDATNRPTLIATSNYSAKFTYAATGDRVKEELVENLPNSTSATRNTTLIRGPRGYEQEAVAGSNKLILRHEIGDVSVVITRTASGTGPVLPGDVLDINYKHNDRLGSPLAISNRARVFQVLDGSQIVSSRRSFDAFGKTRNADFTGRTPNGALGLTSATREGFTGQEHLDSLGLVHMNGRVYDYRSGRFLSVDPIIANPLNSQSLNPYSYIGNNPLSGVDPTGYIACGEVSSDQSNASGSCDFTGANGKTTSISYSFNANGDVGLSRNAGAASAAVSVGVLANNGADGTGPTGPSSKPSSGSSADIGAMAKTVGQQAMAVGTNAVRGMFPENAALLDKEGSGQRYSNDVGGFALGVYNTAARAVNDVDRLGWLAASSGQYAGPGDFFPTFAPSPEMQRGAALGEGATFAATIFGAPERILARGEAPLASVLEGHAAGQGFTGVFDASTGRILLRPSTADAVIPEGWVARAGGHADVSAALGGNRASHSGFAAILQENGSLNITWRSGSLNPAPSYLVPSRLRSNIVDAVEAATGRTVNQ